MLKFASGKSNLGKTDIDYVPNQPIHFNFKSLQKSKECMNGINGGSDYRKGEYQPNNQMQLSASKGVQNVEELYPILEYKNYKPEILKSILTTNRET